MRVLVSCRAAALIGVLSVSAVSAQTSPAISKYAAARFLRQASWGPTADSVAHLQAIGYSAWIDEQFAISPTDIPDVPPDANGRHPVAPMQQQFFQNAVVAPDQLRQRVAWALSQIWVVSAAKDTDATQMLPYWRLLLQDAFGSYRQIMSDVTLSPAMGRYLDMVNNDKPNPQKGTGANENYARELLQLFTIGLSELNNDGTLRLDTSGQPIPTYDQDTVEGFARAFTGWTYAPATGSTTRGHNPARYDLPMVAWEPNHDTGSKQLLNGLVLPANQTAAQDLSQAFNNILQHNNVGPFVCRQLIQHLVTSAPTGDYVRRVAAVFANSGNGLRGDMGAVIKAILLDPEARQGDTGTGSVSSGHLQEPVLFMTGVLRATGATVASTNNLPSFASNLGQNPFTPPTVFNYFPPDYTIEQTTMNAPEFAIYSPSSAMLRVDFLNSLFFSRNVQGVTLDLTPWTQLAANPDALLDDMNTRFYAGSMPLAARNSILIAVRAAANTSAKAQTALYLSAGANLYNVQP